MDSLVPGPSPADLLKRTRERASQAVFRAQSAVQQLVPLGQVQQLAGIYNSTVRPKPSRSLAHLPNSRAYSVPQRCQVLRHSSSMSCARVCPGQVDGLLEEVSQGFSGLAVRPHMRMPLPQPAPAYPCITQPLLPGTPSWPFHTPCRASFQGRPQSRPLQPSSPA